MRSGGGSAPFFWTTPWAGARSSANTPCCGTTRTSRICRCSSNTSTATRAAAWEPPTRPGGPAWWPCFWMTHPDLGGAMEDYYKEQGLLQPHLPRIPPQRSLAGQSALVTGAGSGIGKAVAIALGEAGANVAINYVVHPEQAEEVAQAVRAAGAKAVILQAEDR